MGRIVMESRQLSAIKVLQQHKVTKVPSTKEPVAPGDVEVISEPEGSSIQKLRTPSLFGKKFGKYLRWVNTQHLFFFL